jgi:hypothetical protein
MICSVRLLGRVGAGFLSWLACLSVCLSCGMEGGAERERMEEGGGRAEQNRQTSGVDERRRQTDKLVWSLVAVCLGLPFRFVGTGILLSAGEGRGRMDHAAAANCPERWTMARKWETTGTKEGRKASAENTESEGNGNA